MPVHDWTRVDAGIFHDFHLEWIASLKHALNHGTLPAEYYALAEQVAGGLHPDVLTLERNLPTRTPSHGNGPATPVHGGIALDVVPPRVRFTATTEPERYARKQNRIVIRHRSGDAIAAVVEIISPGNKGSQHALRSLVEKAREFLDAGVHLLILDLFPPGPRDPQGIHGAIWSEIGSGLFELPADKPLTLAAYDAGLVIKAFVEPVAVGDHLPDMPLFLEPDIYVPVPLDATYQAAFAEVPDRWRSELETLEAR